ncbi:hypothetical protein QT971_09575 [Microcoleus sp. herbarium19]|uniref:hypothetical protein n=1 Tax=unclassified Microcoleus TaxID=2642155 RepID=UPI002FD13BF0
MQLPGEFDKDRRDRILVAIARRYDIPNVETIWSLRAIALFSGKGDRPWHTTNYSGFIQPLTIAFPTLT